MAVCRQSTTMNGEGVWMSTKTAEPRSRKPALASMADDILSVPIHAHTLFT